MPDAHLLAKDIMDSDPLRGELVRVATRLDPEGVRLIVGGGYGLVLKRDYLRQHDLRSRFVEPPYIRSTNDIDCFLTADLLVDANRIAILRNVLAEFGFVPVDTAKYFQFVKTIDYRGTAVDLKFDFLAPPVFDPTIKMDDRRIRLKTLHGFHATTRWSARSTMRSISCRLSFVRR